MKLFNKILSGNGNILYYPGCLTKFAIPQLEENYKKILEKIGIDFIILKDKEFCCGSPVLNSGNPAEAKELAEKNFDVFKKHGIKKIITNCPACFKVFSKDYPQLIKDWNIEVEHTAQTIANAIKQGKIKPEKIKIKATYHDPCHLSKHCNIYEEPREVLKEILEIKEMPLSKENSFCCGAGAGVKSNYKELANVIAKERIKMAQETGTKYLVTTCPMCFLHLKENSEDIKVIELSQLLIKNK